MINLPPGVLCYEGLDEKHLPGFLVLEKKSSWGRILTARKAWSNT